MSKKKISQAETDYYCARERWGESNLDTMRKWEKWQDLKAEVERAEIKKKVNSLIENSRKWWKTPNDALEGKTPDFVLKENPERIKQMIYFLESGEPI